MAANKKATLSLVTLLCLLASTAHAQPSFSTRPNSCTISSFYNVDAINAYRATFTPRIDIDCCYYSTTRSECCMDYVFVGGSVVRTCRCSPAISCGLVTTTTTTPAPTTTTTTTTPAPTTTTTTTPAPTTTTTTTPAPTTTTTTTPAPTTTTTTTPAPTTTTTTTPAPTTATTTTTTTPAPTTTSTTTTTTPAPTTVTTTPAATTTTTTPTTTTTATTTPGATTSTTMATTTTPFTSLCSNPFRLLNGRSVLNECTYAGVARAVIVNPSLLNFPTTCNLVYTSATVNGVFDNTFLTHTYCVTIMTSILNNPGSSTLAFDLEIGIQKYPITYDLFDLTIGTNGNAYVTVKPRYKNILSDLGPCQTTACGYDNATMNGLVDFTNCKMVSYGSNNIDASQNGLNEAAVQLNPTGCANVPDMYGTANALCFSSVSGLPLQCSADSGSPVYCTAPSNGEEILMGVTAFSNTCGQGADIKVVPYPG